MNNVIRYLSQEEKQKTRSMYEEIFEEDSRAFVDYYYEYKIRDNQIIVMEEGSLEVMIHLNPFQAYIHGEVFAVYYIVAVATDPSFRKLGKMAQLMKRALIDMYRKRQPFTFLMPVNPSVYTTAGFRFLPDTDISAYENVLKNERMANLKAAEYQEDYHVRVANKRDVRILEEFTNRILTESYDLFIYRDATYFERLLAEVESENGKVILVEKSGNLIGTFSYGSDSGNVEIKEAVFLPDMEDYMELALSNMARKNISRNKASMQNMRFMVRILDLRMLGLLLKSEEPFFLRVQVTDDTIMQNNGGFEIKVDSNGSSIRTILPMEVDVIMNISELAEVLFHKMKVFLTEWV